MLKKKEPVYKSDAGEVAGERNTKALDWGYIVPVPGVRYYRFVDPKVSKRAGVPGRKVDWGPGK